MSVRRLRVLIQRLPPESATMTALRNALSPEEYEEQARNGRPEEGRWSMDQQLLAGISDALRDLQYITVVANSDGKGRKPKRPEPMRRPGVGAGVPKRREELTTAHAEFLFSMLNPEGAA
ncbi:DUF5361 domain-containing protein [Streptomyces sp. NBC_01789]|uniref:DUF5361 domain-containing protein n=1 Tax=Streptomyces sp. NBC_01789 TaxID=2975941 RepID=UPI002259E171|nr:DUF5361 domain-containing protein [Streptomyces sp. NBC_01789]MCX4450718.1 DUF5361 domain-containing protein [Streptomyces sp. NBC_01789]